MTTAFDALMVQRFDDLYDSTPSATLPLAEVLDAITDGAYAAAIRTLRTVFAQQGEDAYRAAKQRLPQITFAGTFAPTRAKDHLVQHSDVCHADVDHLPNLLATKQQLQSDPHVLYCFTSPRGDGLKYGVRILQVLTDDAYKHAWAVVAAAQLEAYQVTWDPTGKDICRLCFVSWDPACYINPAAEVYPVPAPMVTPPPPRPIPATPTTPLSSDALHRQVARAITVAVRMIEQAPEHHQHHARLRAARLLGGYVAGQILSYADAYEALRGVTEAQAHNVKAAMKTIADGLKYGQEAPITLAELQADWEVYRTQHYYQRARCAPSIFRRTMPQEGSPWPR